MNIIYIKPIHNRGHPDTTSVTMHTYQVPRIWREAPAFLLNPTLRP